MPRRKVTYVCAKRSQRCCGPHEVWPPPHRTCALPAAARWRFHWWRARCCAPATSWQWNNLDIARVGVVPAGWRQSRWHSGRRWGTAHQRLQGDQVLEYAVAELLEEGEIQRHIRRVRREYATRRDVLVKALREHLAERITFEVPAGGIALWVRAIGVDVDVWARSAREKGAIVVTAAEMGPPISVLLTAPRVLTLARRHPAVRPAQRTSIDRPASARNSLQRTAT